MSLAISQAVRDRLTSLENEHGRLSPRIVVDDARQKDSPLHGMFEWDVKKAALRHWLHRARVILHSVRVIQHAPEVVTLRAPHYVRDPHAPSREQGYVSVLELQKDPAAARESLRIEFSRVEGALTRARSVAGVLGLEAEIEALIRHLVRVRDRVNDGDTKAA